MSEDIFSQFFNLFNNEEQDVNWELAKIYDRVPNFKSEFNKCLSKFVLFLV